MVFHFNNFWFKVDFGFSSSCSEKTFKMDFGFWIVELVSAKNLQNGFWISDFGFWIVELVSAKNLQKMDFGSSARGEHFGQNGSVKWIGSGGS